LLAPVAKCSHDHELNQEPHFPLACELATALVPLAVKVAKMAELSHRVCLRVRGRVLRVQMAWAKYPLRALQVSVVRSALVLRAQTAKPIELAAQALPSFLVFHVPALVSHAQMV
jgi:hypothetical protein